MQYLQLKDQRLLWRETDSPMFQVMDKGRWSLDSNVSRTKTKKASNYASLLVLFVKKGYFFDKIDQIPPMSVNTAPDNSK